MIRTGFRTRVPPRRPARQWEGGPITPRAPALCLVEPRLPTTPMPKENLLQHKGYMDLVRALPCAHCFKPPRSEFCHADEGKGTGIKTDCRRGWPGCSACHYLIGSTGTLGKRERRRIETLYGELTRAKIIAAGTWPKRLPLW